MKKIRWFQYAGYRSNKGIESLKIDNLWTIMKIKKKMIYIRWFIVKVTQKFV